MKLYTNKKGQWFGTQAQAKASRHPWTCVDVPTDKPSLLSWLNFHAVGDEHVAPIDSDSIRTAVSPQSNITKPHAWQTIRECAEQAELKDLGVALAVLMNRLEDAADNVRH